MSESLRDQIIRVYHQTVDMPREGEAERLADRILAIPAIRDKLAGKQICDICDQASGSLRCDECAAVLAGGY